ncbi:hypothetical protein AB1Y20_008186 [Prymnesium parvum]|uniref:Uncharacterized protein n=1 Tax=Prymnesium parvum TaxID=97485 RepID=A0AB34ITZ2_PRYPA
MQCPPTSGTRPSTRSSAPSSNTSVAVLDERSGRPDRPPGPLSPRRVYSFWQWRDHRHLRVVPRYVTLYPAACARDFTNAGAGMALGL